MKTKFLAFLASILILSKASAYTLIQPNEPHFPVKEISIEFSADSCANTGTSIQEWKDIADEATKYYWNSVATSAILIKAAGFKAVNITADSYSEALDKASTNTIILGCSTNATIFTVPSNLASGRIDWNNPSRAVMLINNTVGTYVSLLTRQQKRILIAHEMGHALGLGHSSSPDALMYYDLTNQKLDSLHKDDIDGITYLYPHSAPGACGTIDTSATPKNFGGNILIGFFLSLAILSLFSKKRKFEKMA